jgi:hypothetical protein
LAGETDNGKVVLVNLHTGAELLRWDGKRTGGSDRALHERPFFIGDRIGIPTRGKMAKGEQFDPDKCALEIWAIPADDRPERTIAGLEIGAGPTASHTGRIAWIVEDATDVYDVNTSAFVFSNPPRETRPLPGGGSFDPLDGPEISPDGRFVMNANSGMLWEIDTGREPWPDREVEYPISWDDNGRIEIKETWSWPFAKTELCETYALRDSRSGELVFRTWWPPLDVSSRDGTLIFHSFSNTIHKMPPRVNWLVLALCQAILALPLLMIWASLRWRRKRKARLA